jgi:hypothetical protein
MRYSRDRRFGKNLEPYTSLIGLKSKKMEGQSFVIDKHDLNMIALNLRQKEIPLFKKKYRARSSSSFAVLQTIEYERKRRI